MPSPTNECFVSTRSLAALAGAAWISVRSGTCAGGTAARGRGALAEVASLAGFAGGDGGRMAALHHDGLLDYCLIVPTASMHRVQETHVALYHIIWDLVHEFLATL